MPDNLRGGLTLIGTPIGNLGDMGPRAQEALRDADVVLAEDTRVTGRLLAAYGIDARLERCDENVMASKVPDLIARMLGGESIALVSDAGMPAVADPGARLVDCARDAGVPIDVIPGPSAVTCAVAQSGFTSPCFYFGGFLPRRDAERGKVLETLRGLPAILVFYESPHRVVDSLRVIGQVMPGRRVAFARELTKLHQEVMRASAPELADELEGREAIKGEFVLLIDAPGDDELRQVAIAASLGDGQTASPAPTLREAVARALAEGRPKSSFAKELAKLYGVPKSEVYDLAVSLGQD